jgi:hypothetical protein
VNRVPGVEIGHGIDCLALTVGRNGQRAAVALSPDQADSIALDLIRQAAHARVLAEQEQT